MYTAICLAISLEYSKILINSGIYLFNLFMHLIILFTFWFGCLEVKSQICGPILPITEDFRIWKAVYHSEILYFYLIFCLL